MSVRLRPPTPALELSPRAAIALSWTFMLSWTTLAQTQLPSEEPSSAPAPPTRTTEVSPAPEAGPPPEERSPELSNEDAPHEPSDETRSDGPHERQSDASPLNGAHPCDENPRSPACAASCAEDSTQLECENACEYRGGLEFCSALCQRTNLNCHRSYRAPEVAYCPAFHIQARAGVRGTLGAQIHDRSGFYGGAELFGGVRLTPGVSLIATGHFAIGVDNRPGFLASTGASGGLEFLVFDALVADTALAVSPQFGVWLPNYCFEDPCPLALLGSLGLRQMVFRSPTVPSREAFQAYSFGLESGLGYDPWRDEVLARLGLSFGFDLAF